MFRRALAAILWFYAGLCLGALVSFALGLPGFVAPALGIAGAMLVMSDPVHIIWARRTS